MTDAAIISGSLVDVRNVGAHKSVKLTIHVPEEFATRVVEAFGWPTGARPVEVAVARMSEEGKEKPSPDKPVPQPQQSRNAAGADKPKKSPAQIAGYLCTLGSFHEFLREKFYNTWLGVQNDFRHRLGSKIMRPEDVAAEVVRDLCGVESRAHIHPDNIEWLSLQLAYKAWEREAEVVG